jgi:2-polyprenyl-3-methyl-5-hydroxy-6-metoxy-1,4-benzoquinol methylase
MVTWISTRTGQFAYFDQQLGHPEWAGKKVLDFGGNVGNLLLDPNCTIEPANYWSIDVSRDAIPEGRQRHPEAHFVFYDRYNFEYNQTGTVGLPIPDPGVKFDIIVGWSIFTHNSKAEMFELTDQLMNMLTADGVAAFTFIDPNWTPPDGWARDNEAPGFSNLRWRLEARHATNPDMDVPALLEAAARTEQTWTTLVNDDELYFDPDDDGLSEDKPQRTYITFCTPDYMRRLFPTGRVLDPIPPERQSCVILDKATYRS